MSWIVDKFKSFWSQYGDVTGRPPVWFGALKAEQIVDDDLRNRSGVEIEPGLHYVDLGVRKMNLCTDQFLTTNKFPVVHSHVTFVSGGGSSTSFPAVVGHGKAGGVDVTSGGNFAGTGFSLIPQQAYHDGHIELVAGVVAMNGDSGLQRLTKVVNRVTKEMLPAAVGVGAAVETGVKLTTSALSCIEDLFDQSDSTVVLGMFSRFGSGIGIPLRTGLYALLDSRVLGDKAPDPGTLVYDDEELKVRTADGKLAGLRDCDWMVLEIGVETHRSYKTMPMIDSLMDQAFLAATKDRDSAIALHEAAVATVLASNDVVRDDYDAILRELREDFARVAIKHGRKIGRRSLPEYMAPPDLKLMSTDYLFRPAHD
ncbi:hypothetical protein [Lentzea kentuckyensis]|uniref:hypothetical protein n=1 Tax=Lentzea kentuckyensis TaxID=360086 RepID=UPI000A3B7972|nr:hypothetical protein [Lentzea kentuckyensis]